MAIVGERQTVRAATILENKVFYGEIGEDKYIPPIGYVIVGHEIHETLRQGRARINIIYQNSEDISRTFNNQNRLLKKEIKQKLKEIHGRGNFEKEYTKINEIFDCTSINLGALTVDIDTILDGHISGNIDVEIMYIGNSAQDLMDAIQHFKES